MTLTRNSSSPTVPWWEPGLTLPLKCSPNGPIPAKAPWAIRLRNDPRQPEYWVADTFGGMPVGGFSTGVGGAATAGLASKGTERDSAGSESLEFHGGSFRVVAATSRGRTRRRQDGARRASAST